jgi:hypothetical protein
MRGVISLWGVRMAFLRLGVSRNGDVVFVRMGASVSVTNRRERGDGSAAAREGP